MQYITVWGVQLSFELKKLLFMYLVNGIPSFQGTVTNNCSDIIITALLEWFLVHGWKAKSGNKIQTHISDTAWQTDF
jgi:hypothetical protein